MTIFSIYLPPLFLLNWVRHRKAHSCWIWAERACRERILSYLHPTGEFIHTISSRCSFAQTVPAVQRSTVATLTDHTLFWLIASSGERFASVVANMAERMRGEKQKTKQNKRTDYEDVENHMNTGLCSFSFIALLTQRVPGFSLVRQFQMTKSVTSS